MARNSPTILTNSFKHHAFIISSRSCPLNIRHQLLKMLFVPRAAPIAKAMQTFITDGWQIPAECRQCRWIRLCRGGCKRDRNATDTAQRSYYCKALQKFFAYAEPRLCEMVRAVQMYR